MYQDRGYKREGQASFLLLRRRLDREALIGSDELILDSIISNEMRNRTTHRAMFYHTIYYLHSVPIDNQDASKQGEIGQQTEKVPGATHIKLQHNSRNL